MHNLGPLLLAGVASALLHLGLVGLWERGPGPPPLFLPLGKAPVASSPPLHWVEVGGEMPPSSPPSSLPPPPPPAQVEGSKAAPRPPAKVSAAPMSPAKASSPAKAALGQLHEGGGEAQGGAGFQGEGEEVQGGGEESAVPGVSALGASMPSGPAKAREDNTALQQRLQAQARGCYPARARRFRFQGTVQLAFCVDAQGMAVQARLVQSSGYESLDEAALECVLKKAQPLPVASWGLCFQVPIFFGS